MLKINNMTKKFGKKTVLNNISFTFEDGIYGLLGPNGSGKTTLMRCITGLYNIPKNTIIYKDVNAKEKADFYSQIGYLSQSFGMFKEITVKEMLELFASLKEIPKKETEEEILRTLKMVNLSNEANTKIANLSGGMVRRVGIAQALLGDPKVIIFDEPTVGLDPEERLRFKNIIAKLSKDKIVIISTHIVEDVEAICNKIIIMNKGSILVSEDNEYIENIAKDKVYVVPENELSKIDFTYEVEKRYTENGINYARILCDNDLEYKKIKSTIEDGYMYAIHKNENAF